MPNSIPSEILDDLSSRFIVNIPEEEKREPIRLCFQVELAYWFYLDFFCTENPSLKNCGMKEFTAQIFEHIPFLTPLLKNLDKVIDDWRTYKSCVPTYGAIIFNEELTKVLLVQSYFTKSSWGFPKGKVNELESPYHCAIREVFEETGLDISKMIKENDYVEAIINEQIVRLYLIQGVNEQVTFQPQTRNEIRSVEWFAISDLPSNKKDATSKVRTGVGPNSFYMVLPFMKRIRSWVQEKKQESKQENKQMNKHGNSRRQRNKSTGETPTNSSPLQPVQNASKNKKHNQSTENESTQHSTVKNGKGNKQQNKTHSKRQLFSDDEKNKDASGVKQQNQLNSTSRSNQKKGKSSSQETQFIVPRWLNFKLDKVSILKCFDD